MPVHSIATHWARLRRLTAPNHFDVPSRNLLPPFLPLRVPTICDMRFLPVSTVTLDDMIFALFSFNVGIPNIRYGGCH